MKRLSAQFKATIQDLTEEEKERIIRRFLKIAPDEAKEDILLSMAREQTEVYDFIEYEHTGIYADYFAAQKRIGTELAAPLDPALDPQLQMAKRLSECLREVNLFVKMSRSKRLEISIRMDLIRYTLEHHQILLGSGKLGFASKLGTITQKTIHLILGNRPAYLWPEYAGEMDAMVATMKAEAIHVKTIANLPIRLIGGDDGESDDLDEEGDDWV